MPQLVNVQKNAIRARRTPTDNQPCPLAMTTHSPTIDPLARPCPVSPRFFASRITAAAFVLVLSVASGSRGEDAKRDIWLLSTRCAPRCGLLENAARHIDYSRLDCDCCCTTTDASEFKVDVADTSTPTVVFIHGNNTDACGAVTKGMYAYRAIRSAVGCSPFRYVIWSWPADRVCRRHRNDVPLKACYSDVDSYYLACWLDELPPAAKVSLAGHSFGPRIIAGALELLAGGKIAGRKLPDRQVAGRQNLRRPALRAVFLAAAIDAHWLSPCGRYGRAMSLVEEALVTCNCCDRVLRFYPLMYGRGGPQAMGRIGPCGIDDPSKVQVRDVSCSVGKTHDWRCYCSSPSVAAEWARYTFLADTPAEACP